MPRDHSQHGHARTWSLPRSIAAASCRIRCFSTGTGSVLGSIAGRGEGLLLAPNVVVVVAAATRVAGRCTARCGDGRTKAAVWEMQSSRIASRRRRTRPLLRLRLDAAAGRSAIVVAIVPIGSTGVWWWESNTYEMTILI